MVQVKTAKSLWLCLDREIYLSFTKVGGLFKSLTLNNNNSNDNTNNNHINISSNQTKNKKRHILIYQYLANISYLKVFAHSEIFVRNFCMLKNKYDLTLWQSRLHTASKTFVHQKKFGSCSIFCVFASVAFTLIGKDEEYKKKLEKRMQKFRTLDMV